MACEGAGSAEAAASGVLRGAGELVGAEDAAGVAGCGDAADDRDAEHAAEVAGGVAGGRAGADHRAGQGADEGGGRRGHRQAWREAAAAPGPEDPEAVLGRLMDRAIDFYNASLPLVAGSVADTELLRRQQEINREAGTGPQLAIDAMENRFRSWQQAGQLDPGTDPYSLAPMFCGSAQLQAYVEYLAGPGELRGTRDQRITALVHALTRATAPAGTLTRRGRGKPQAG